MQSWGGKLVGNTVRLAGILALLDHADVIDRAHWDSAEVISESYLIPCAAGLFLGVDPYLTEDARKVLDKIKGMDSFSQADLWRSKVRSIPLTMNAYLNALDCLALYGYIRKAAQQPAYCGRGSKPSPVWEVNPALRKRDAQKWEEKEL